MASITGDASDNVLEGTPFTDILDGRGGADWLYGRESTDRLIGGDGTDVLDGGPDIDWMEGGDGDDLYIVDIGPSNFPILFATERQTEAGLTTASSPGGAGVSSTDQGGVSAPVVDESFSSGDFSPARSSFGVYGILPSVPGGDVLIEESDSGTDTVEQRTALYVLWDNIENLRMTPEGYDARGNGLDNELGGNVNTNFLYGGSGDDILFGYEADDHLEGEAGDDTLIGGTGIDYMWGGPGADTFRFDNVADTIYAPPEKDGDRIQDFRPQDNDRIDLSLMDADSDADGDQDFVWRGTQDFTGPGQVRYEQDESRNETIVELNTDDDDEPDAIIHLVGFIDLSAGDFVL